VDIQHQLRKDSPRDSRERGRKDTSMTSERLQATDASATDKRPRKS
jgi:hypothetical protein